MYSRIPIQSALYLARPPFGSQAPPVNFPPSLFVALTGIRLFSFLIDSALTLQSNMLSVAQARLHPPQSIGMGKVRLNTGP